MMKFKPVNTVLVDDEDPTRWHYANLLYRNHMTNLQEHFRHPEALLAWLSKEKRKRKRKPIDVIVLDTEFESNGLSLQEIVQAIRELTPNTEILPFSLYGRENVVAEVLEAGAEAFVMKKDVQYALAAAVWLTMQHDFLFSPSAEKLIRRYRSDAMHGAWKMPSWHQPDYLSPRLYEIAQHLYLRHDSMDALMNATGNTKETLYRYKNRARHAIEDAWELEWYDQALLPELQEMDKNAWLHHVLVSLPDPRPTKVQMPWQ